MLNTMVCSDSPIAVDSGGLMRVQGRYPELAKHAGVVWVFETEFVIVRS